MNLINHKIKVKKKCAFCGKYFITGANNGKIKYCLDCRKSNKKA